VSDRSPDHDDGGTRRSPRIAAILLLIALAGVIRLVATYRVFSQTIDEPIHIAAGFEWLSSDHYALDPEHPPLARILFALGAKLEGAPWRDEIVTDPLQRAPRGNELLYRNDRYQHNLALARLGNLPFFLLGLFAVFGWSRRLFGGVTALVAAALYSALPPILAHAGLATTDMAAAATVVAALYALDAWLHERTWMRSAILGVAVGLGLLSKYSFLAFFGAGAIALLVPALWQAGASFRRRSPGPPSREAARVRWRQLPLVVVLPVLMVWSCYGFSTGTVNETRLAILPPAALQHQAARFASYPGYEWMRPDLVIRYYDYAHTAAKRGVHGVDIVDWAKAAGYPSPAAGRNGNTIANAGPLPEPSIADRVLEPFRRAWQSVVMRIPLPAPTWIGGAEFVAFHSEAGHPGFLLGEWRDQGWWYYFPVLLFFKTPLPFLGLALAGLVLLRRRALAYIPLLMLIAPMTSRINIGVRHVLPLYPILAIVAAVAVIALWRRSRVATIVLTGWFFVAGAVAHPDYLPYFNEAARRPETIALDSNLDWGQDLLRLEQAARRQRLEPLHLAYFGSADWRRHGIPATDLPPERPVRGWVAISEMQLAMPDREGRGDYAWLQEHKPVGRVGKSIRLYRIP
jgi:hypothetical protein